MYEIDTSSPVLVTGATGYVAGWIVKVLLEAGVTVHAAVRDPSQTEKCRHLDEIAASAPGEIKYFKADLLDEGTYAEAMAGCSVVFHTASPFVIDVNDPQSELVDPAKLGTRNVLAQAGETPSVRRVVVTSSCAAIYGDNADIESTASGVFTEDDWNTTSSLTHNPYSYSKTEAEKEAWKIAGSQSQWELVTINPSLVMGPGLNPNATSESFNMIMQMGDGSQKRGTPDAGVGVVDVRDLAEAHVGAAYTPGATGRYIISAHDTTLLEMAATLLPKYGNDYPIPRRLLPKWLIWLVAPMVAPGITRKIVSRNFGYPWRGDSSRSVLELGVTYRPLAETMNDFFQQMVDSGRFGSS
ncbi:NAD-dependent epimerase/dehydratase family protein [Pseudohalioglobus lutimaris]|uniref:Diaminohydroxyphosphoribosylaminopyrimidine deaminase n=1 Tax=Pseudohalioglobus lutimaris TaxID=1737061 RepID=A0A2N5X046_9GAMM|nr:NAD-dependent epimerase/dehydratase family protein [Pseudohalioglobus lutimaris]PLW67873.1 diaminohydroxyphosphoribosylaminopyrimidine deaminase [Pseudohalioglobus lutimaris]